MKKIGTLLFLGSILFQSAIAQYQLSGSGYTQNFNDLDHGLPEGWSVDTNASATRLGGSALESFVTSAAATGSRWSNSSGAFKNMASANTFTSFAAATPALQSAATDRALGIKQTATFGDAGAAFTFCIDNTFRLSNFRLDIKIQSLDSSGGSRITPWQVQYGFGDNPKTFSTVSAFPTGGNTYKNFTLNIPFGSALDDIREKVWIRIVSLSPSSGTGSRTATAIDDVELYWDGIAIPGYRPLVQRVFPETGTTDVPLGSTLSVLFSRNISLGSGSIMIRNETDHSTQTIDAGSSFLSVRGKELSIAGVKLDLAKTYHVTFDSTIVDTVLAATYGIGDSLSWRFSTVSSLPYMIAEHFDTACAKDNALPSGWTKVNVKGAEEWQCMEHAAGNSSMRMFGNDGTDIRENEDWLISPRIDMSSPDAMGISFHLYKMNSGKELEIMVSHDYAGSGSPDSASWTSVSVPMSAIDVNKWLHYTFSVGSFKSQPFYIGFKYSSTDAAAYDVRLDSFMLMIRTAIHDIEQGKKGVQIVGYPTGNHIEIQLNPGHEGVYQLELLNAFGQCIYKRELNALAGSQRIQLNDINLPSGLYVLKLANNKTQFLEKCMVR